MNTDWQMRQIKTNLGRRSEKNNRRLEDEHKKQVKHDFSRFKSALYTLISEGCHLTLTDELALEHHLVCH